MKKFNKGQEILLLTNSSLAKKELSGNDASAPNMESKCRADKLQEACWNGLLNEWIPESVIKNEKESPVFLWKINAGNTFLCVEMSEAPVDIDLYYSLDPYLFLPVVNIN